MIERFKEVLEKGMFGVFSVLAERMGITAYRVRLFFVYISFFTFGSPIFIYLSVLFILNINNYITNRRRNPIWDF
jgi:phage shock protein PspC (stress-responsive transcriptional regulator)